MFDFFFPSKEKLKSKFIDIWQQGDLLKAMKLGEKLVKKDPLDFENIHDLAMVHLQLGLNDSALNYLHKANELHESDIHWNNIGRAHQALRNYKQAKKSYEKSRKLNPENPMPWYNLTVCYREQNNMNAAFEELNKLVKVHPNHLGTHSDLGLHLEQKGEIDAAIEQFEIALKIDPDYYPARENMILILCDANDKDRASDKLDFYRDQGMSVEIMTSDDKITQVNVNGSQFYPR